MRRTHLRRTLLLAGILALAMAGSACETYVGVGVGYGYPGYWGAPWPGGYVGGPMYY
jgi:hypothetical protein